MATKISETDFAVLAAQTGLPLDAEQLKNLHAAYEYIEIMTARIGIDYPREAEPSLTFKADAA
jgi:hypothetical protein